MREIAGIIGGEKKHRSRAPRDSDAYSERAQSGEPGDRRRTQTHEGSAKEKSALPDQSRNREARRRRNLRIKKDSANPIGQTRTRTYGWTE